jgi:hypothetical protein
VSRRLAIVLAAVTAVLVFLAGSAYGLLREDRYTSTGQLVAVPKPLSPDDLPSLIGGFQDAGLIFTYVELSVSEDTLRAAGSPPVSVTARAVPDSRVLSVTTEGSRASVRPALSELLNTVVTRQARFGDPWRLRVLQRAQPPESVGPSPVFLVLGSLLMGLLGGLVVYTVATRLPLGRLSGRTEEPEDEATPLVAEDPGDLAAVPPEPASSRTAT